MTVIQVKVPTPLRAFTAGQATVEAKGRTVGEVVTDVVGHHQGLRRHLLTPDGQLRNFVTLYLNDEDVRYLQRDATPVKSGDVISIVPAIAGGSMVPQPAPTRVGPATIGSSSFDAEELRRYSRHLLLPEVGVAGQKLLRSAKVLLVGAGGLGAPTALYLAAAGVGQLGIVDFDRVEVSNLQRQVLYGTRDIGRSKLDSARERLTDLNPRLLVEPFDERLTSEHAMDVIRRYDIVVDGTDNFPTRYLVNDACVLLGKPNVYGSIYRFEGQASVFDARVGPC